MKGFNELFVVGWMLFGIYIEVFIMILADLWSGIRKAKIRGEIRSSYGYKKTIDKIARYYNAMIALTVIDIMQMGGVWYLDGYYGWSIPIFPVITLLGALGISLVELKSIYEKADEKVKGDYKGVAVLAAEIVKHKTDPAEIAAAIMDYMKNEDKEEK
ncbi:phage holin family protein [Bacteroides sp. UBA939]|uniref:phage holin family protein n=1 Tax=Bacteroides sp. UBA939 TaxID=1946092 RepID=UPI0025BDCBAB|nr:phage holin family protein [Bacteroides sp. UBA939]